MWPMVQLNLSKLLNNYFEDLNLKRICVLIRLLLLKLTATSLYIFCIFILLYFDPLLNFGKTTMASNMMKIVTFSFSLLVTLVYCQESELRTPRPTISSISEFIASPQNKTILEGDSAVLRCKMRDIVYSCQWFYLEHGLDLLDKGNEPTLVMTFSPTKHNDCSIKFSKVNPVRPMDLQRASITQPKIRSESSGYFERNATEDSSTQTDNGDENDKSVDISFHLSDEGHLINTKLGDNVILGCQTNHQLNACSWIRPDGTTLNFNNKGNYALEGNYTVGNCSLRIIKVTEEDEGNWRCVVSTDHQGFSGHAGRKTNDSSLIIVLVTTSIILLIIIVALVIYMYKRVWRRNSPPHKYLDSNKSTSEYSTYGSSWLPGTEKDGKLMDDCTEMQSPYDKNQAQNNRYLDMSGNKKEEYMKFPDSVSQSSRTTISTAPAGHNAIAETEGSARTSASDSLHSASTFGNVTSDASGIQSRELPRPLEAQYSSGHLYEEIDDMRRKRDAENQPDYSNIEEDTEGYMIPKSCSPDESITMEGDNQTTTLHNSEGADSVSNPTYSDSRPIEMEEESYDAPSDPPVPVRIDSVDNPLAEYDVPKPTPNETNPVFI
ncbi:hypothetical protein Avbf_12594 [Armadillidium vulgare]|nr:hypothetical protein Avbf_12594 [Armadillidium vulgare]